MKYPQDDIWWEMRIVIAPGQYSHIHEYYFNTVPYPFSRKTLLFRGERLSCFISEKAILPVSAGM